MNEVEKRLKEEKKRIDQLETPSELEGRLRSALSTRISTRRKKYPLWRTVAAVFLACILIGYNYNALAYYGKKIIGFDEVVSGTLQDLNEAGMGQVIDKSYSLGNGVDLIINGLMSDENRMIVYYTITDANGNVDKVNGELLSPSKITGFFTNAHFESGVATINDANTELKGTMDFEPPSIFAKKLTLHLSQWGEGQTLTEHEVSFPYDPNKAMKSSIKQTINQDVAVDGGELKFKSIVASPTMTVIKGKTNDEDFDRIFLPFENIELVANGIPVERKGSGYGSSIFGTRFDIRFDALPNQLNSLEIKVEKFSGHKQLDQEIDLQLVEEEQTIDIGGENLWIKDITTNEGKTEITIITGQSVLLDEVYIGRDQEKTPLETTVGQTMDKTIAGELIQERTLIFNTTISPEKMFIGGMQYMKEYSKTIELPID